MLTLKHRELRRREKNTL